jgi:Arc/MetJ-type ribon-helix-helix transcriptional regulator
MLSGEGKTRVVSIRLSEEQYRETLRLAAARGYRSVSEFARDAMRLHSGAAAGATDLERRLASLESALARLQGNEAERTSGRTNDLVSAH